MSPPATDHPNRAESPAPPPDGSRIGVSGTQVAASVLASVSAAVVASFFGVAGTIVGAAVVSVVATVGSAAYGLGLRRTQARLQQVQALRIARPLAWPTARPTGAGGGFRAAAGPGDGGAGGGGGAGAGGLAAMAGGGSGSDAVGVGVHLKTASVGDAGDRGGVEPGADASTGIGSGVARVGAMVAPVEGWWAWLSQRRWSLGAGVAAVLVISLATVTLVELVGNRPLSGDSDGARGTSLGQVFSGDDGDPDGRDDGGDDAPDPSPTTAPPADSPSTTAPAAGGDGRSSATDGSSATTTSTAPPTTSTTAPPTTTPVATTVPVPTTADPTGVPADPTG